MYKKIIMSLLIIFVLTACANTRENAESYNNRNKDTHQIHNETGGNQNRNPNIQNTKNQNNYQEQGYSDAFTNEESLMLTNALKNRKGITQAQVASTEDRVVVAVMLSDHSDHQIANKIKSEIEKIVPHKQIIVYTDDTHWERMKNIDAKLRAKNIGSDMEDKINDFFNRDE